MAKRSRKSKTTAPANTKLNTSSAIATVHNDITIANYSDVLHPLDDTLIQKGGGEGLKIYDEIERDTHAYSVLQKRKHQLIGREWIVKPGGEDKIDIEAADFIRDQLDALPFDQICLDMLDATLKGFSISELIYAHDGKHIVVTGIKSLEQRRFIFDSDWKPRLLTLAAPSRGEQLPERKFMVHRFGVKGNNPYGLGLGTRLFWPVLFKRNGVSYWQRFLERFASPIPVGKHPNLGAPQQRELMRTLSMMSAPAG
jgi:phage gp29-like protein